MTIKVGVAVSELPDTKQAVLETIPEALATAGLARAGWAVCFFTMGHLPRADLIRELICKETGCAALWGCSAAGLLGAGREVEGRIGLVLMVGEGEGLSARSALLEGETPDLAPVLPAPGMAPAAGPYLFALPDAYRVDAAAFLDRVHSSHPGLPCYGAGATDNGTTGVALQLGMEGVRANSVAALSLAGDLEVAVGITQSCTPIGEPHFITEARENLLLQLDGRPALQVFIEQGQALGLESFQELVEQVLPGFPLDSTNPDFSGESCLVRHVVGFDQQSGGIHVPHPLRQQTAMAFMHRNGIRAEQDMHRMVEALKGRLRGPPDFGLYFNCAARGHGLYGREGVDTGVIREVLGEFPLAGMKGGFEMATNAGMPLLYTYTGVLVLIRGTR